MHGTASTLETIWPATLNHALNHPSADSITRQPPSLRRRFPILDDTFFSWDFNNAKIQKTISSHNLGRIATAVTDARSSYRHRIVPEKRSIRQMNRNCAGSRTVRRKCGADVSRQTHGNLIVRRECSHLPINWAVFAMRGKKRRPVASRSRSPFYVRLATCDTGTIVLCATSTCA